MSLLQRIWDRFFLSDEEAESKFGGSQWFESRHERELDCPDTQPLFNEDGSSHIAESMPAQLASDWDELK